MDITFVGGWASTDSMLWRIPIFQIWNTQCLRPVCVVQNEKVFSYFVLFIKEFWVDESFTLNILIIVPFNWIIIFFLSEFTIFFYFFFVKHMYSFNIAKIITGIFKNHQIKLLKFGQQSGLFASITMNIMTMSFCSCFHILWGGRFSFRLILNFECGSHFNFWDITV